MGDHFENQVLLIKTAWGGKSLYKDFRPPSSGGTVGSCYTNRLTFPSPTPSASNRRVISMLPTQRPQRHYSG
jgi:hypothetical protein